MPLHIPYKGDAYKLPDALVPDNSRAANPVVFHIVPAWGPDLARIKSVIFATSGLVQFSDWSPSMQDAVTQAFEHGALAFQTCIERIEGLTIPAAMALRAGLIGEIPSRVFDGESTPKPDPAMPVPVLTGPAFARICGAGSILPVSMSVAARIAALTDDSQIDPRFFVQPSGSGPAGTLQPTASTAPAAPQRSSGRGTAARRGGRRGSRTH